MANIEELFERSVIAQEKHNGFSVALIDVQKSLNSNVNELKTNLKEFNDKFALHCTIDENHDKKLDVIIHQLLKWVKILGILLFLTVGGTSIATWLLKNKSIFQLLSGG